MTYLEIASFLVKTLTTPSYLLTNEMNRPKSIVKDALEDLFGRDFDDDVFVKTTSSTLNDTQLVLKCFVVNEKVDEHFKCFMTLFDSRPTLFILMDNYIYDTTTPRIDKFDILLRLCKEITSLVQIDIINIRSDTPSVLHPLVILNSCAFKVLAIWVWRELFLDSLDGTEDDLIKLITDNKSDLISLRDIKSICAAIECAIERGYYDEGIIELLLDNNFIYSIIQYYKEAGN